MAETVADGDIPDDIDEMNPRDLMFQCSCCAPRWWWWPHSYLPPVWLLRPESGIKWKWVKP